MRSITSPPPALQRARPGDHARAIYSAILRSHERHSCTIASEPSVFAILMAEKMSGTSVKIIKNGVGCRDDTVPKTVETRRHYEED